MTQHLGLGPVIILGGVNGAAPAGSSGASGSDRDASSGCHVYQGRPQLLDECAVTPKMCEAGADDVAFASTLGGDGFGGSDSVADLQYEGRKEGLKYLER